MAPSVFQLQYFTRVGKSPNDSLEKASPPPWETLSGENRAYTTAIGAGVGGAGGTGGVLGTTGEEVRLSVSCKMARDENREVAALGPARFYLPAYMAHRGWIAPGRWQDRLERGRGA